MNKNLIYIVSIDHPASTYKTSDYSGYSINTWKYWCNKHNVDKFKVENFLDNNVNEILGVKI